MITLYKKTLYTIPSDFVICPIYEYDISKANISILLNEGLITTKQFQEFYEMPREERQIKIGLMQRNDKSLVKSLESGFEKARQNLCISNNIQDDEIISIKKDAMFVCRPLETTQFGAVRFLLKNVYNMMVKIFKIELYFNADERGYVLDVKGIKQEKLLSHQDYYIRFLCELFNMILYGRYKQAIQYVMEFIRLYNNRELSVEYYREFNSDSMFRCPSTMTFIYTMDCCDESSKKYLDITYNQKFNTELYKVVAGIYTVMCKKPRYF